LFFLVAPDGDPRVPGGGFEHGGPDGSEAAVSVDSDEFGGGSAGALLRRPGDDGLHLVAVGEWDRGGVADDGDLKGLAQ